MKRKLRKIRQYKWIGGVCAGLAYWLGLPTWIVRLILIVFLICYGFGIIPYLILWLLMTKWENDPTDYDEISGG